MKQKKRSTASSVSPPLDPQQTLVAQQQAELQAQQQLQEPQAVVHLYDLAMSETKLWAQPTRPSFNTDTGAAFADLLTKSRAAASRGGGLFVLPSEAPALVDTRTAQERLDAEQLNYLEFVASVTKDIVENNVFSDRPSACCLSGTLTSTNTASTNPR
eukprot:m.194545 g.194545  ORF g.194545 m.194545 type:complete len:158 (-) comp53707_c0_seq14:109-582(-)